MVKDDPKLEKLLFVGPKFKCARSFQKNKFFGGEGVCGAKILVVGPKCADAI